MSEFVNVELLLVVLCACLAGLFTCIACVVWEPGLRQGWKARVGFFVAVVLATVFAVASLIVPALEL